jgi:hypothetical protein
VYTAIDVPGFGGELGCSMGSVLVGVRVANGSRRPGIELGPRCSRINTFQRALAASSGMLAIPHGRKLVVVG